MFSISVNFCLLIILQAFYVKARRSVGPPDGVDASELIQGRKGSAGKSLSRVSSTIDESAQPVATAVANLHSGLPLTRTKQSSDSSTTTMTSSIASASSDNNISPLKILIVEDNIVNQKVLAKQLQKAGCIVQVANHGGEAIEFMKKTIYYRGDPAAKTKGIDVNVILMDLEMPVMDGITCARNMRKMQTDGELRGHIPIIAVTANAREKQIETALSSGMVSLIMLHPLLSRDQS